MDPDGGWVHLAIGAAIGGVANVWQNRKNIGNFLQGLGYFGIGAAAGALSAAIGNGVGAVLAGQSFTAGMVGTSAANAAVASLSGFTNGFLMGAASGTVGGFGTGFGNSLMQGNATGAALANGGLQGLIGGATGGLTGGLALGTKALFQGKSFWDGAHIVAVNNTVLGENVQMSRLAPVRQNSPLNCGPANGEFWDDYTGLANRDQNVLRGIMGGGDQAVNPVDFMRRIGYPADRALQANPIQIAGHLNRGGFGALSLTTGEPSLNHMVTPWRIVRQTTTRSYTWKADRIRSLYSIFGMNPANGTSGLIKTVSMNAFRQYQWFPTWPSAFLRRLIWVR
jgi:hypothetical protein